MGAWAIALHGGAGMISKEKMSADWQKRTEAALNEILDIGIAALESNLTALEAVELVVSNIFQMHLKFFMARTALFLALPPAIRLAHLLKGSYATENLLV